MASKAWSCAGKDDASLVLVWLVGLLLAMLWVPDVAAAGAQPASTTTWVVQNCQGYGTGSLRDAINQAASGDSIDLTQLTCQHIDSSLYYATLTVSQDDLTLVGPGRSAFVLDGGSQQGAQIRVITHTGAGTLTISGMSIAHAAPLSTYGGCIASHANVSLTDVVVTDCTVTSSDNSDARGGGVYADGNVYLSSSVVRDSHAIAVGSGDARGGGIYAGSDLGLDASEVESNTAMAFLIQGVGGGAYVGGNLVMVDSQVLGNRANNPFSQQFQSYGGGLVLFGTFSVSGSTIADNFAPLAGGFYTWAMALPGSSLITDSTIVLNRSRTAPAGIFLSGWPTISSSTVAFNAADQQDPFSAAGIAVRSDLGISSGISISSSIVAGNTSHGQPSDIYVGGQFYAGTVTGSHNLIFAPFDTLVPQDTLVGQDPMLGVLGYHGGPTQTLALLAGSPARDAGSHTDGLSWDQRGVGFARVVGSAADIGAFESRTSTLNIAPPDVAFGGVPTLSIAPAVTVVLTNTGDTQVQLSFLVAPQPPFYRVGGNCGSDAFTLYANASCTLIYVYAPVAVGHANQTLSLITNLGNKQLILSGTGVADDVIFAADFDY
ncbi:MAG: hypothetical protein L0H70_00875 [Xanthomonadales bacterium]|nr:hypothetical protein [Xanthomonadales bacterium]